MMPCCATTPKVERLRIGVFDLIPKEELPVSKKHAILAAAAATLAIGAGVGTFAAFSDSATSTPVTAGAGTLYLKDGIVTTSDWALSNLAPEQVLTAKTFTVKKAGTLDGKLVLTLTATGPDLPNQPDVKDEESTPRGLETAAETPLLGQDETLATASELPKNLRAKISLKIGTGEVQLIALPGAGTDGFAPLTRIDANSYKVDVPEQTLSGEVTSELSVTLAVANAGNELQGDGANITLAATLTQA
jgi:alternate signal-mediated exported protein